MPNVAVLLGNVKYQNLATLECCASDLAAMRELLAAAQKYETIEVISNATADEMRERIRAAVARENSSQEVFFYFTGHGVQLDDDFYYCGTNFDSRRPNETGLSTEALHQLLRLANADLVIKVVDACISHGNTYPVTEPYLSTSTYRHETRTCKHERSHISCELASYLSQNPRP